MSSVAVRHFCPVSGLELFWQDEWRRRAIDPGFTANFIAVGPSILYSSPSGVADLRNTRASLQINRQAARQVAGGTGNYIQIEDYQGLERASMKARRSFIARMAEMKRVSAIIFCNLSPLMKVFVNVGQRFNPTQKRIWFARNYAEAVTLALELCREHRLDIGPNVFDRPTAFRRDGSTLRPSESLHHAAWDVVTDGYVNRSQVLDRFVLQSISEGYFEEDHVPPIDRMRHAVREHLSPRENLDYLVVDVSRLRGGTRIARQRYMKSLKDWHERFPFRMYVLHGANTFTRTAARLGSVVLPFRVELAGDLQQAFDLIQEDRRPKEPHPVRPSTDPIAGYRDELLARIEGIDWDEEGLGGDRPAEDETHPLKEVFQAIDLLKDEMQEALTAQREVESTLAREADFQGVLGEIATDFINTLPAEVDDGVNRALKRIGEFVDADRSYIIQFDFRGDTLRNTHEWCRPGIEPQIEALQDVPAGPYQWVIDRLVDLQVVHVPELEALPYGAGSAREQFAEAGIQSLLLVPLVSEGRCTGTVGFDFVQQKRACTESEVRLLFMSGATLSSVLDRKRAEEALRASHQQFLNVLNSIDATIYVADMETYEVLFMNQNMIDSFGRDMTGKTCWKVFRGESGPCPHCTNDRLLDENGNPAGVCVWQGKNPLTGKWYINYDRAIEWTDRRLVRLQIATDITVIKRMEEKLQETQKMEAIGTLAGGIAHDFNNLLMGIQGRASLLESEGGAAPCLQEHVEAIEEYVRSASDLTKQLLGFARGGKYEVKPLDVNALLRSSAAMFGRTHKEILIHTRCGPSPLVVEADQGQVEQVLLNLFVNAWQAMPGGGELVLETGRVELDEEACAPNQMKPGSYVKLSVTDTGSGMDQATCQRIFDPFFTTKEKARGTGLGLASAYGIVKNHGGMITVDSEPGRGTTFDIHLPLSERGVPPEETRKKDVLRGRETILLVDDEAMIIEVGTGMLEKLGYRVMHARSGEEALEILSRAGDEIDLVILDMVMPGMDGRKTFERLRDLRQDVPVVLSSGYAITEEAGEILKRGCRGFLQKPFDLSRFSLEIRRVLDMQPGRSPRS